MKRGPVHARYRAKHTLPNGYTVEFTLHRGQLHCVWSPEVPTGKKAGAVLPHYRTARDAFLRSLGMSVMVVEL